MVRVKEDRKLSLPHFTPHDLRRTGATFISSLGFSDEIIDAVLAHLKKGVIKIYNRHGYDEEKKRALIEWEKKLLSLISPPLGPIYKIKDGKSVRIFRKRKEE